MEKRRKKSLVVLIVSIVLTILLLIVLGFLLKEKIASEKEEERPRMIIGLSAIVLEGGEIIGTQVDRVVRDIAWEGSSYDINSVSADKIPITIEDLVPYMEGQRAREMMDFADAKIMPLTPARAKHIEIDQSWPENPYFAGDGQGNFIFLIEPTKIEYKSVYFSEEDSEDIILPDTHGFNMIAEQAYLNRIYLDTVMACMDFESKAEAALYLAKEGLNIYAPCDRFTSLLMNYKESYPETGTILGSAPLKETEFGAVLGDNVNVGINVSFMPGVLVGSDSIVGPHSLVRKNIEEGVTFYTKLQGVAKKKNAV